MHDIYNARDTALSSSSSPSTADIARAGQYLRPLLSTTILTHIFDIELALDRALRILLSIWKGMPQHMQLPFYSFVTTYFPTFSFLESHWETAGMPRGAISLFFPVHALDAPMYQIQIPYVQCPRYYIMDVVASDYSRFIPSTVFVPYKDRSSQRCRQVLDRINSMPLWFFGEDGSLGFPIEEGGRVRLLHGDDPLHLMNSQNKSITTLKVKFGWPNYQPTEKQIRASPNGTLNNLNRLASLTAGAVRNFMGDEQKLEKLMIDKSPGFHPWQIGTQPGRIRISDVILLGVIFVSDGAAMPLLAMMDSESA
ncbi:unnamed protein product [Peniophora sp. CBMAI 1063]|nr:unnamed protein product [Peniophora sp. CBMAI 1063]